MKRSKVRRFRRRVLPYRKSTVGDLRFHGLLKRSAAYSVVQFLYYRLWYSPLQYRSAVIAMLPIFLALISALCFGLSKVLVKKAVRTDPFLITLYTLGVAPPILHL